MVMAMEHPSRALGSSLHHQVFAVLRSGIVSGRYGDGDYLPGEESLTAMFGVSRATIRRALLSLEQEGLIERRQGRGTRVVWQGRGEPVIASLSNHLDMIDRLDAKSSVLVRGFERACPPDSVRAALGLAAKETAWRLIRARAQDAQPLWLMVNHFPLSIGDKLREVNFTRTTLFNALKRAGHACVRAEETVGATLADPQVAAEINVKVGAPLLELSRVILDAADRPIAHQLTLVPPERRKLRLVIQAGKNGLPEAGVLAPLAAPKPTARPSLSREPA
jgi:GntR family transcriptional regulator